MAVGVQVLDLTVVGPLVRDVERRRDRAAIRILATIFEQVRVELAIEVVDGVVERQQHYLRCFVRGYSTYAFFSTRARGLEKEKRTRKGVQVTHCLVPLDVFERIYIYI